MTQEIQDLEKPISAEILASRRLTPDSTDEVRQIDLRIADPMFRCAKGQSIAVAVPGPHEFGNKHHIRRYSVADNPRLSAEQGAEFSILVRRCFYTDDFNGERYPGVASNYLCDARPGDRISLTGPYKSPFTLPTDSSANLVMIATGTAIAPFRSMIQHIYQDLGGWQGQVRLYYGAKSGMDLLYMNEENDDLANYYDQETFQAFKAIASRPILGDSEVNRSLAENAAQALDLMREPNTHVFVAGIDKLAPALEKALVEQAGSEQAWSEIKQGMIDTGRWAEFLFA
ncbi:MAG: oxidoreductase [Gammaproteobacteria bacterium]